MKQELDRHNFIPKVLQVIPTNDFCVYVYFNDGSVRLLDMKPLIKPDTVFESLRDITFFKTKLAVINDTVAWDVGGNRDSRNCIDLDPCVIFEQPAVEDPLNMELRVAEQVIPYSSTLFSENN